MATQFTLDTRLISEYHGKTSEKLFERIDAELSELERDATVVLDRPTEPAYLSKYLDAFDYVFAKAAENDYTIRLTNPTDARRLRIISGSQITGNQESGYRFQRAA